MFLAFLTFIAVTAVFLGLIGFALYRIANHIRGNEEATKAVVQHVLVPLLGRATTVETEPEAEEVRPTAPEPKPAKEVF